MSGIYQVRGPNYSGQVTQNATEKKKQQPYLQISLSMERGVVPPEPFGFHVCLRDRLKINKPGPKKKQQKS